jgi:outer membrane protein TolC
VGNGGASEIDRALALAILKDTEAQIPLLESALGQAVNGLSVLLSKPPGDVRLMLGDGGQLPNIPQDAAIGMPTDLLRRRPDVRRVEREAAAQCARIGATKARLFPSITLLGGIGFASSSSGNLFDSASRKSAYGGMVNWDILLYPFIVEKVRIQDARYQELILLYQNQVIRAAQEVESAALAFVKTQDQLPLLEESADASRLATRLSLEKCRKGEAQMSSMIHSLEYFRRQRSRVTETRGALALNLVLLYKALGGGWEIREGKPFVREDVQAGMFERTDWSSFGGRKRFEVSE